MRSTNIQVKAQIEPSLRDALTGLAQAADRSLASEIRRALREHVAREQGGTDLPPSRIREVLSRLVAAREELGFEAGQTAAILTDLEADLASALAKAERDV